MPTVTVNPTGGELDLAADGPNIQIVSYPTGGALTLAADAPTVQAVATPTDGLLTLAADAPSLTHTVMPTGGAMLLPSAGDAYGGGPVVDSVLSRTLRVLAQMVG